MTLDEAQARLTDYLAAEKAVLQMQSYRIDMGSGSRQATYADLAEIRAGIKEMQHKVSLLSRKAVGRTYARQGGRG